MSRDKARHPLLSAKGPPRGAARVSLGCFPSRATFPRLTPWIVRSFFVGRMVCEMPANKQSDRRGPSRTHCRSRAGKARRGCKSKWPRVGPFDQWERLLDLPPADRRGRPRRLLTSRNAAGRRCDWRSRRSPSGSCRSRPSGGRAARRRGRERRKRTWTSEIPFSKQAIVLPHF